MISHNHKIIFVHIPQRAGQSIETAFLNDLGLTWQQRHLLLLRRNEDQTLGPNRLAHLFAREHYELGHIDKDNYTKYYKFSVVRNPIDRITSELNYRMSIESYLDFSHKVKSIEEYVGTVVQMKKMSDKHRHLCRQTEYLNDLNNNLMMDEFIRYEEIERSFSALCLTRLGKKLILPIKNASRLKKWNSQELSESDKKFIKDFYSDDFIAFGY